MVNFEGRQYSAPFRFVGQEVEVRGLAGRVQILEDNAVIAVQARGTDTLILRDEAQQLRGHRRDDLRRGCRRARIRAFQGRSRGRRSDRDRRACGLGRSGRR